MFTFIQLIANAKDRCLKHMIQVFIQKRKHRNEIHIFTFYIVTVVKRGQFGNPKDFFQKTFEEYERGFGEEEKGDLM